MSATAAQQAPRGEALRNAREWAQAYIARGWQVVPLPRGRKRPVAAGWQQGGYVAGDVDLNGNVGLILGDVSGDLVDIDLDCPEAIAAAPLYLPQTGLVHGRVSAMSSHWWYVAPGSETCRRHDPDGSTLVELRSTGGQTVAPPSIHEQTGELIEWVSYGEPAAVDPETLVTARDRIAAAAMLARRWPAGARHDVALALAGVLRRGGLPLHDAERLVEVVARVAGDGEWRDRVRAVHDTYAATDPTTGAPTLAGLLRDGEAVVTKLREWLGLVAADDTARPALRVVTVAELLSLDIPPREMMLAPWLPDQGLAMLYGPRGAGKTYLLLAIALAIAAGGELLAWRAPRPRRVLYLDGEMPAITMRERLARLIRGGGIEAPADHLRIVTPDLQTGPMPDLGTCAGRAVLDAHVAGADLVIVDSISTLTSAAESEADEWLPLQRWVLDLRRAGRSVLLSHHAGKGGQQRGTSRREDVLDTVLALRRPADYRPEQGARAELVVEKGRGIHGDDARTVEMALADDGSGGLRWTCRTTDDAITERVAAMVREGLSHRLIAAELHCGVATVSRHRRLAAAAGLLEEGTDE